MKIDDASEQHFIEVYLHIAELKRMVRVSIKRHNILME